MPCMHANPNMDLDTQYDNLTDKQRAVIDAYAQNPNETNREIARIAGREILGEDPVNESYCSEIINKEYSEVAEYRAEIEQNERGSGSVETTGDPFDALQENQESFQSIQDRPVKQTSDDSSDDSQGPSPTQTISPIQVASANDGIVIKLSYSYVEALLKARDVDLPEDMHEQLVDALMQRVSQAR